MRPQNSKRPRADNLEGPPAKARKRSHARAFSQDQLRTLHEAAAILGTSFSDLPQVLSEVAGHPDPAGQPPSPEEGPPQNELTSQAFAYPDLQGFGVPHSYAASHEHTSLAPWLGWVGVSDNWRRSSESLLLAAQEQEHNIPLGQHAASNDFNLTGINQVPSISQTGSWALWSSTNHPLWPVGNDFDATFNLGPGVDIYTPSETFGHNPNPFTSFTLPLHAGPQATMSTSTTHGRLSCEVAAPSPPQYPAAQDNSASTSSHTEAGCNYKEAGSDEPSSGQSTMSRSGSSPVRSPTSQVGMAEGSRKAGRRGPFRSDNDREQAKLMRKMSSCIRCRLHKIRVSILSAHMLRVSKYGTKSCR